MNNALKIVIATLERHYSPPVPPRINGIENLNYRMLVDDYVKALKPFMDETLERGMREFLDTWKYARWPKPGELASVIRSVEPERAIEGSKSWAVGYWDAVKERCSDFVDGYMASPLAQQAKEEGWAGELYSFVRKVAWYQTQVIEEHERKGKRFSIHTKDKEGKPLYPLEHIEHFLLEDLERFGAITVNVPTADIERMKRKAVFQAKQSIAEKPSYMPGASFVDAAE